MELKMRMRSIATTFVFGFIVACGGAADEQPPVQPPPPPAPAPAPVDTTPAPVATTPPPAPKPALADLEAAAIASMVANANDSSKIAALYAPDAVEWTVGLPEAQGREAIQKGYQSLLDNNTGFQAANVRTWTKGNQVVVHWIATASDKATGKPWGLDGLSVYTFNDDGLITKDHTYLDFVTMMKQTGAYKDDRPFRPIAVLPTGAAEAHVSKGDANEDKNVANLNALNAAWLKSDDATQLGFLSDDYASNSFAGWEPKDKKWVKDNLAIGKKSFKDRGWKDLTVLGVEDFTIDEGESTMTQIGDFVHGKVKIPNKHKTVTTHGVSIHQWKDGKIVKAWGWSNGQELDAQLGIRTAAPKPAAKGKTADAKVTTKAPTK
jgi:ketosteroid isomerase-like protein